MQAKYIASIIRPLRMLQCLLSRRCAGLKSHSAPDADAVGPSGRPRCLEATKVIFDPIVYRRRGLRWRVIPLHVLHSLFTPFVVLLRCIERLAARV